MSKTHGLLCGGKPPEYFIWIQMKQRCNNPNHKRYKDYGARGISVCKKWMDSFESFIKDVGWRPSKELSIDRIDNSKGYEPSNVRWATSKQQSQNRDHVTLVDHNGKSTSLKDYCKLNNLNYGTVKSRIERDGWTLNEALKPGNPFRFRERNEPWKQEGISATTWYRRKNAIKRAV